MRSMFAKVALAAAVTLATLAPTRDARAEEEFNVSVAAGKVTVAPKGEWHINLEYPWTLTVGGQKMDKSKWTLSEKSASVAGAPKGEGEIKGAVCSGPQCKPFKAKVTVQ